MNLTQMLMYPVLFFAGLSIGLFYNGSRYEFNLKLKDIEINKVKKDLNKANGYIKAIYKSLNQDNSNSNIIIIIELIKAYIEAQGD